MNEWGYSSCFSVVLKRFLFAFNSYLLKNEEKSVSIVKTVLQHMCTKVPDKTEYRGKVATSVVKLLQELPNTAYGHMVQWFYKLSKHSKVNNLVFYYLSVIIFFVCSLDKIYSNAICLYRRI
jgi:condensin-2 complex subunit D3